MKAAVWYGPKDLRIEDAPMPAPGPEEVLIKVKACGVCGTDVHIYEGDKGSNDVAPPRILGHEMSGVVEEVGSSVNDIRPGDRVCVDPNILCGRCYYCHNGIGHFCENMRGVGTTIDGGFAEYCGVDRKAVYPVPDDMPFELACMAEPVACCLHGMDMCNIRPGSHVVVIGGGMIGLIMLQLAKVSGASKVVLIEPVAGKREKALQLGASFTIDPASGDVKRELAEGGVTRVETAIECVGLPATMSMAVDLAGRKSVVMMFGLTKPDDTIPIKPFEIFRKETEIKASFINPYTQSRAIELLSSGRIDVVSMQCDPIPLEELEAALSDPEKRKEGKWIVLPEL
jgi:threonine dehydrogenase-like Zn-dependent dehydrogenase